MKSFASFNGEPSISLAVCRLPDDIAFVADIPHTATGKISKRDLRERFKDFRFG